MYDASEQVVLIEEFSKMLAAVTKDGGNKRAVGEKPPWWNDPSHEAAIFSHLNKWKHGEVQDPDSGEHPLVHLAWRALAIAYQESRGKRDPQTRRIVPEPIAMTELVQFDPPRTDLLYRGAVKGDQVECRGCRAGVSPNNVDINGFCTTCNGKERQETTEVTGY